MKADTTRRPLRPAWASTVLMKWTRHLCQVAFITLATEALMPSCASEITSLTPRRPRRASFRRKSVQKVSASEGPTSMPSTSLRPSLFTPTATITATETIRPSWRTFTEVASIQRYGHSPSIGRSRNAPTRSSISWQSRETWLLDTPVPPMA